MVASLYCPSEEPQPSASLSKSYPTKICVTAAAGVSVDSAVALAGGINVDVAAAGGAPDVSEGLGDGTGGEAGTVVSKGPIGAQPQTTKVSSAATALSRLRSFICHVPAAVGVTCAVRATTGNRVQS